MISVMTCVTSVMVEF